MLAKKITSIQVSTKAWLILVLLSAVLAVPGFGQTKIKGIVKDVHGFVQADVLIYLEGRFDETTSDSTGYFELNSDIAQGEVAMLIGHKGDYLDIFEAITIDGPEVAVEIFFTQKTYELNTVTVKAKRNVEKEFMQLKSIQTLDAIFSSSDGNVLSSINTLPGANQVGETGELSVRGGAGYETRYFVDGMLLRQYLGSSAPGTGGSFRLPASMFKQFQLNTGGYSAEYGQALSSVLLMETQDLPSLYNEGVFVSPFFASAQVRTAIDDNTSLEADFSYVNFALINDLLPTDDPNRRLVQGPETVEGNAFFKKKLKNGGFFKSLNYASRSQVSLEDVDINQLDRKLQFHVDNDNIYTLNTLSYPLGEWNIKGAFAAGYDKTKIVIDTLANDESDRYGAFQPTEREWNAHLKLRAVRPIWSNLTLNIGTESFWTHSQFEIDQEQANISEILTAVYAESSIRFGRLNVISGSRLEYSNLLGEFNFAPRMNVTLNLPRKWILSYSSGKFFQTPQSDHLLWGTDNITFAKAQHHIIGVEKKFHEKQSLKVEAYDKRYTGLIKIIDDEYTSEGHGSTRGFEILWMDRKTFNNIDYWCNYAYTDAKRDHLDYLRSVQPEFASKHQASMVLYKNFPKISTIIGTSYTYQSGRPYYNPNRTAEAFLSDLTPDYHFTKINIAHSFNAGNNSVILVVTLDNLLGRRAIYNYEYATSDPTFRRPITPLFRRFLFVGGFLNFGTSKDSKKVREILRNRQ